MLVETRWFESDRAWFKHIRQELGSGRGRSPHWLVFNDEAHHAYRRGDGADSRSLDETEDADRGTLAKKNAREATIWIEGLDRINKLAGGGRKKGIRLCVDLSATPFYIQGSGNEVGKPLPWVVSDFGLLDAIESGLVKVPQLPTRDITGAAEASYFNVWRWVEHLAERDGHGTKLTPELVMTYATAPINQLAQDWHVRFVDWREKQKGKPHPLPPVFILVCRDTQVASAVYDWLAGWLAQGKGAADAPPWFRNAPGQEVTVRIDSRVVEDLEAGGTKDETRRLHFILDATADKCHLNAMAADTRQWEQSAGFALDTHPAVARWVKNEHLNLRIPYRKKGVPASYFPDFIAVLVAGSILLIEIKGQYGDDADLKAKAAERWVAAVNRAGEFGAWRYRVVTDPPALMKVLDELSHASALAAGV